MHSGDNLLKTRKGGKYVVFKLTGEEAGKGKYDAMSNGADHPTWPEWPAVVAKKNKYGLLAESQLELLVPTYEYIGYLGDNLYVYVEKGKKGMMASNGKVLSGAFMEALLPQSEKYLPFKQNGKWGYVFNTGKVMIAPTYDEAGAFYKNLALIKVAGKWGATNKQGRLVVKNEFDSVQYLPNGKRRLISSTRTIEITERGIVKQVD